MAFVHELGRAGAILALGLGVGCGVAACSSPEADTSTVPDGQPDPDKTKDGGPKGPGEPTGGDDDDSSDDDDDVPPGPPATCTMATDVTLTFEEQRLVNRLPTKNVAFATEILTGTGFDVFEGAFSTALCKDGKAGANSFDTAKKLVIDEGTKLWRAAVDRVQGKVTMGTLPKGDDRMLYWARLTMTKTLRAWRPSFALSDDQRKELDWEFERASRGQHDLNLPAGTDFVRIVVSGFDPFTLGNPGSTTDANIRIGNPSGASALAYDGFTFTLPGGKTAHIETFILPVNYGPFERGMEEDTLGPTFKAGPARADIAITMSQGSGDRFDLEEYNGRFHGIVKGNDDIATCTGAGVLASTAGCAINPPERWLGYNPVPFVADKPAQFVDSTLPIAPMIAAKTGEQVTKPPGSTASGNNAFDVVWDASYQAFGDCTKTATQTFNTTPSATFPPPVTPTPPAATSCARVGSGGDYLSNESAYRATALRQAMGLTIPVGHIHTPVMSRFDSSSVVTDAKFEAYRAAIVLQGRLLIEAVAKSLP